MDKTTVHFRRPYSFLRSIVYSFILAVLILVELELTPLKGLFDTYHQDILLFFLVIVLTSVFYTLSVRKIEKYIFFVFGIPFVLLAPIIFLSIRLGWTGNIGFGVFGLMTVFLAVGVPGFAIGLVLLGIGTFQLYKR